MENTIKVGNGILTVKYVPKYYNFGMLASDGYDDIKILYVEYSSDFYRLEDKLKTEKLFKEFEPQIIRIMKFYVNENIGFYKHFDIDFTLIGDSAYFTSMEILNRNYFHINCSKFIKAELKSESLEYLKGMTDEQKRLAHGF